MLGRGRRADSSSFEGGSKGLGHCRRKLEAGTRIDKVFGGDVKST
jgi:hypothetical protein